MGVLSAGQQIDGRYVLVKRLGAGTFGEVWKARDGKFPNVERFVALKFLKEEHLSNKPIVARFEKEADALAALHHEHVIAVTDRGDWNGGRYMAMEFVAGRTLEHWLEEHQDQGRLPDLPNVQRIFDQICAGVAAAHAVAIPGPIVHRDLKPENVMLRSTEDGFQSKVLDFGIARLGARSQESRTGFLMGTILYMAPEQRLGQSAQIGPWTDVFALGVILVQMLSLRALPEPNVNEAWWGFVMRDETRTRPLLGGLRADVPAAVWDVAAKALRRDGPDRYATAGDLRRALRDAWGLARSTPTPTPPPATPKTLPMPPPTVDEAPPRGTPVPPPTVDDEANPPPKPQPQPVWPAAAAAVLAGVVTLLAYLAIRGGDASSGSGAASAAPATSTAAPSTSVAAPAVSSSTAAPRLCPADMIAVPGGTFRMGSEKDDKEAFDDERPPRDVTLRPFCIDVHEVTVAKYRQCAREARNGLQCPPAPTTVEWSGYSEADKKFWGAYCNGDRSDRDDHPINCVDWTMADTYCRWTGGALPTEAQWEYAARGTDRRKYPWGNEPPDPTRLNACGQECREMAAKDGKPGWAVMYEKRDDWGATAPVGRFPAGKSPFGAMDMAGNVWEWVLDKKAAYDPSKLVDPVQTEGTLRVLRGGGWLSGVPRYVRAAIRLVSDEGDRHAYVGFRCARGQNQ